MEFTLDDLKLIYPQFDGLGIPDRILEMYLEQAKESIRKERWHSYWKTAIGLYVAHFATLWTMGTAEDGASTREIAAAGENQGMVSSKSAGGVSISRDYSIVNNGLTGWAAWNQTKYGTQLATLAKLVGKGGMQVW